MTELPESLMLQLSEFVGARMGLNFPKERWHDLERGINSSCRELGFDNAESCIRWLISSPLSKEQVEILAGYLTIGETYFFRERKSFEVFAGQILPELIRSRRGKEQYIRIWSAGCASGEEPYSIAILLSEMIPDLADWNITVLATDINPSFIRKAGEGVYSDWSFRDTPAWVRKRYFKKIKNDRFEIIPQIKKMVIFAYHNLAEDSYPSLLNNTSAMDIVFCRNVLMYFIPEHVTKVIRNLYLCLIDGGWLVVSPVETSLILFPQFETVNYQDVIFYKKDSSRSGRIDEPDRVEIFQSTIKKEISVISPPESDTVSKPIPVPVTSTSRQESIKPYDEALALYRQGNYAGAIGKITGLILQNHNDSKAILLLSRAYANQGKSADALKWCEKAIASDRLNPGCHYLHAMILQERGQVEDAMRSLQRALYLDQDFVLAHYGLANLSRQQEKIKESDRYFENCLMLLRRFKQDEILPESDGITAGRLSEIIISMKRRGS